MTLRVALGSAILLSGLTNARAQQRPPLPTTDAEARELAATITTEDLREHLTIISADDMEGRETGEPGQKRAAEYLRQQFAELGFPTIGDDNTHFQKIRFSRQGWNEIELVVNDSPSRHLWEYYSAPSQNNHRGETAIDEVLFLGYGIDDPAYSDYEGQDVNGKHILIFSGEPRDRNQRFRITGNKNPSAWSLDNRRKLEIAHERGVKTVFVIDPAFKRNVQDVRKETLDGRMRMVDETEAERSVANSVFITPQLAKKVLGKEYKKVVKARRRIEKRGELRPVSIPTDMVLTQLKNVREMIGENVLGFVEGVDQELKDEVLVVSAHYDHIGKKGDAIFNGADDNGSGTSTVLEIAEAFATAAGRGIGPRRSVLFLLVSGEEKGLLGSEYYAEHPVLPLENTIADINIDMVGRVDEAHADNPYYIYVIGSNRISTELHDINEAANRDFTQLELDYTYNAEDDPNRYYYRSDHYNFAEKGIPSIFFFNGTHADYHMATDTIEKINFEKMERIARLAFHLAWQLSNQNKRIEVDVN